MANQDLVLVQTRLPKKLADKLKREVRQRNMVSQAALVRQILTDYFAVKEVVDASKK